MSGNVTGIGERYILLPDGTRWEIPPHPLSGRIQPPEELIPRVCMVPNYATSAGLECIEIAASASLILDPWEQLSLILGLGETGLGKWASFIVALIVARQNGKGADLEALGLYWLFGTGELLIGHTAHEYKTAMEAFRRILFLIESTDWMRKKVKKIINTNGEEGVELKTTPTVITDAGSQAGGQRGGQRLRFLARSKGAGRGFTFRKLIWDEAYALSEEQQEAQMPTLSAVQNGQIWVTSSPPLTSDTGKPLFALRRRAEQGGITFMDYGADGQLDRLDEIDLDDVDLWLQHNPNAPERISIEAMQRERVAMGDAGFARERLCIWPPDLLEGFTVISEAQWKRMLDPHSGKESWEEVPDDLWPDPATPLADPIWFHPPTMLTGKPCVSADVSPRMGGVVRTSIGLAQYRYDGRTHLELLKSGSGTDWAIHALVDLAVRLDARIAIDPGSPAGSLLAQLTKSLKAAGKDPDKVLVTMGARDVAQAFGMIYDAAKDEAEQPPVVHIGQDELQLAVAGADKRPVGDGHAWDRRNATVDITPIVSVTHAQWGLQAAPPEEEAEPLVVWGR